VTDEWLQTGEKFAALSDALTVVVVPGLRDSGDEHWQTAWHRACPSWRRITQRAWMPPDLENWLSAINRAVPGHTPPLLLVGHSFGALASIAWAKRYPQRVAGLMLVAPAEPMRFELDDIIVPQSLPCASLLVASHNDPLLDFRRAQYWAKAWGSEFIDIGEAGHINIESGFGDWPWGLARLHEFACQISSGKSTTIG
jgi:predicted alpha/beta hydrolase family esterase